MQFVMMMQSLRKRLFTSRMNNETLMKHTGPIIHSNHFLPGKFRGRSMRVCLQKFGCHHWHGTSPIQALSHQLGFLHGNPPWILTLSIGQSAINLRHLVLRSHLPSGPHVLHLGSPRVVLSSVRSLRLPFRTRLRLNPLLLLKVPRPLLKLYSQELTLRQLYR